MLSEETQEAMNKDYRNCRLFHSRKNSGISTNEDVMQYLQISSDPYINSFRKRMKLKKLEYHDDVKKCFLFYCISMGGGRNGGRVIVIFA